MGSGEVHIVFEDGKPVVQRMSGEFPKEFKGHLRDILGIGDDSEDISKEEAVSTDDHDDDVEEVEDNPEPSYSKKKNDKSRETEGDNPSDVFMGSPPYLKQDAGKAGEAEVVSGPQRIIPSQMAGHPGVVQNVSGATSMNRYGDLNTSHVKSAGSSEPIMDVLVRDADRAIEAKKPPQTGEMIFDDTISRDEMATLGQIKKEIYEAAKKYDIKKLNKLKRAYLELKDKIIEALDVEDVEEPDDLAEEAAQQQMAQEPGMEQEPEEQQEPQMVEGAAEEMEGVPPEEKADQPVDHETMLQMLQAELEKRSAEGGGEEPPVAKSLSSLSSERLMWDIFYSDEDYWKSQELYNDLQKAIGDPAKAPRVGGSVEGKRYLPSHVGPLNTTAPHVDVSGRQQGGPGSAPRGGKYLWRWWDGDHWRYKYADEAHDYSHASPEEPDGIGESAVKTMVQGYDVQHRSHATEGKDTHDYSTRPGAKEPAYRLEHSMEIHPHLAEHVFNEKGELKPLSDAIKSAEKAKNEAEAAVNSEEAGKHEDVLKELRSIQKNNLEKRKERHNPETKELEPTNPEAIHADDMYQSTIKLYDKTHPESLYWMENLPDGIHIFKQTADRNHIKHLHMFPGDEGNESDEKFFADVIKEQFGKDVEIGDDSPEGKKKTKEFLKYLSRAKADDGTDLAFLPQPVYKKNKDGSYEPLYNELSSDSKDKIGTGLRALASAKTEEDKEKAYDVLLNSSKKNEDSFSDGEKKVLLNEAQRFFNISGSGEERKKAEDDFWEESNDKLAAVMGDQKHTNHKMPLGAYKNHFIFHHGSSLKEEPLLATPRMKATYFTDDDGNPILALVHDPTMAKETHDVEKENPKTGKREKVEETIHRQWKLYPIERNPNYSRVASSSMDLKEGRGRKEKFKMYSSEKEAWKAAAWHVLEQRIEKAREQAGAKEGESFRFKPFRNFASEELHPKKSKGGRIKWFRTPEGEGRPVSAYPPDSILHKLDTGDMEYKVEYPYQGTPSERERYSVFTPGWDVYHQRPVMRLVPMLNGDHIEEIMGEGRVKKMIEGAYDRLVSRVPTMSHMSQSDLAADLVPQILSAFVVTYDKNQPGTTFSGFVPGIHKEKEGPDGEDAPVFTGGGVDGYLPAALHHKNRNTGLVYRTISFDRKTGKEAYKALLRAMADPDSFRAMWGSASQGVSAEGRSGTDVAEAKAARGKGPGEDVNAYLQWVEMYGDKDEDDLSDEEWRASEKALDRIAGNLDQEKIREVGEYLKKREGIRSPKEAGMMEAQYSPVFAFSPDEKLPDKERVVKTYLDKLIAGSNQIPGDKRDRDMLLLLSNLEFHGQTLDKGTGLVHKRTGDVKRATPFIIKNKIPDLRKIDKYEDYVPLSALSLNYPEFGTLETKMDKLQDLRGLFGKIRNKVIDYLAKQGEGPVNKAINSPSYRDAEKHLEYEVMRLEKAVRSGEIAKEDLLGNSTYQNAVRSLLDIKKSRLFGHAVDSVAKDNPVKAEVLHYMSELVNGNLTKATGKTSSELLEMMTHDIVDAIKSITGKEISLDMSKAFLDKWYRELKQSDLFKGAVHMALAIEENDMDTLGSLAKKHFAEALRKNL